MIQTRKHLRFAFETLAQIPSLGKLGVKNLYGHDTAEAFIPGPVDLAHATTANPLEEFVTAQTLLDVAQCALLARNGRSICRAVSPAQ